MKRNIKNLQKRLYIIAAVILLVGSGSAALIYRAAGDEPDNGSGYEMDSRMYRHDMELYGGKFNLVADEFTRWFAGLWHGRSLAFAIAGITVITSSGFFLAAGRLSTGSESEVRDENK